MSSLERFFEQLRVATGEMGDPYALLFDGEGAGGRPGWVAPLDAPALTHHGPESLAEDLRSLWAGRPERLDLVDPLVGLCRELRPNRHTPDVDPDQYTLF